MPRTTDGSRRRKRALADAAAGVAGSLVSLWTFYPIEVWKTNLQADSSIAGSNSNWYLFQGCAAKTLHTATSNFCYFFLYSWIVSKWKRGLDNRSNTINPATRLILSAVAAMLNTFITLPLDVMSSKQVTQRGQAAAKCDGDNDKEQQDDNKAMDDVWEDLIDAEIDDNRPGDFLEFQECLTDLFVEEKEDGNLPRHQSIVSKDLSLEVAEATQESWSTLWKGLTPALLLCSNPSINYTVFDVVRNRLMTNSRRWSSSSSSLSMSEAFVVGLFAKFVATISTYPLIRAKVILMVTSEKSLLASLIRTYNQDGLRGLYRGCDWQLLHTVLKSALMMMVREKITVSTHQLIVGNGFGAE